MNKHNLIRLGTYAQIKFDMLPDFSIMEISPDTPGNTYQVALPIEKYGRDGYRMYTSQDYEGVELQKVWFRNNCEYIWMAYSVRANTLLIKECHK